MSVGPVLVGSMITSTTMLGERYSLVNGTLSAPRAGCAFTRSAVIVSTAMPNTSSPPTDHRRWRTLGSVGAVLGGAGSSVTVIALSDAGLREFTIRRLHAASATRPTNTATLMINNRP